MGDGADDDELDRQIARMERVALRRLELRNGSVVAVLAGGVMRAATLQECADEIDCLRERLVDVEADYARRHHEAMDHREKTIWAK